MTGGHPQRRAEPGREPTGDSRAWLIAAFAKALAEHGYANLEVEHVLRHAGVSRAAFEANFTTMEEGLVAAQEVFLERLWLDVAAACEEQPDWAFKVRAALGAILASLAEASSQARVFAIEAAGASLAAAERQYALLDRLAAMLSAGREHYPSAQSLPHTTERVLVGGVASVVSGLLLHEDVGALRSLEADFVETLLSPFMDAVDARRVAASRAPIP